MRAYKCDICEVIYIGSPAEDYKTIGEIACKGGGCLKIIVLIGNIDFCPECYRKNAEFALLQLSRKIKEEE